MAQVHPTAIVASGAQLAADVTVGPYAIVGPHVTIGPGTTIAAHAVIEGHTAIGARNRIHAHAVLGGAPQDKKYAGEPTRLEIGDDNTIREFCTFNTGTVQGSGITRIGSRNWVMAYVHVAHDCTVGSDCILANAATLAGHVSVGDWVILGGLTGVHQFVRIGEHAMSGGGSVVLQDLPPYVICQGNPAEAHGLNTEGLRRRGFSAEAIAALRRAYKSVYRDKLTAVEAVAALAVQAEESPEHAPHLRRLADFVAGSARGIVR